MKALVWNCQGIARGSTIRQLSAVIREHKPGILFLSELKIQEPKIKKVLKGVGFKNMVVVPAIGIAGGISLAWHEDNCGVDVVAVCKNFIIIKINENSTNLDWYFCGVYIPSVKYKQGPVLEAIYQSMNDCTGPFIAMGDFNNFVSDDEKDGGLDLAHSRCLIFKQWVEKCNLIDIGFSGNVHTWINKRERKPIKVRLDRGLANPDWRLNFHRATLLNLPIIGSDHAPMILDTNGEEKGGKRPFKFEAMWTRDDSSLEVVSKAWDGNSTSSDTCRFNRYIEQTKSGLIKWNREVFGNVFVQIKQITEDIKLIQGGSNHIGVANGFDQERTLQKRLQELLAREELIWRQKSRVEWLINGDRNTKFFHLSTIIRRRRNSIEKIELNNGSWVSGRKAIGETFVKYFKDLFSSSHVSFNQDLERLISTSVTQDQNIDLLVSPSFEEIKAVVFTMGANKAPGPDGMSGLFYQHYWDIVGKDLVKMVQEFFETGHMNSTVSFTYISLIPKSSSANRVEMFRPISLCNFGYKVIAKLLANKLKPLLNKIISPLQTAFLPGRSISENVILTQEVLHKFKEKKGADSLMALKLDMAKAFDRVEWNFIEKILKLFGFDEKFVKLIMSCVSSTKFAVLINGFPQDKFSPERGLRQGDPLSPYLFILCNEVLSRMILCMEKLGYIHGVKVGKHCDSISHLMFADDLIVFAKADENEIKVIMDILEQYKNWSGQEVNFSKSGALFSKNISGVKAAKLRKLLNLKVIHKDDLYLGLPLQIGRSKSKAFRFILDRVQARVMGWKGKFLSYAGRATLIKSVLSSIPSYVMLHYNIPLALCRKIDGILRKFWWNHNEEKVNGLCLIAWDRLCSSKLVGGLGFRKMEKINIALLSKLAWDVASNADKFWVKVLLDKYCVSENFMNMENTKGSTLWKSLLGLRPWIEKKRLILIGDGINVKAYEDPWVPTILSFVPKRSEQIGSFCRSVSDLIQHNPIRWNQNMLQLCFDKDSMEAIMKIDLSHVRKDNRIIWSDDSKGNFSSKSMYNIVSSYSQIGVTNVQIWKVLWNAKIHERSKVFLWRCLAGALATRESLSRRMNGIINVCPVCDMPGESLNHVFFDCSLAKGVWFLKWGLRFESLNNLVFLERILMLMDTKSLFVNKDIGECFRSWFCFGLEKIWKIRNMLRLHPQVDIDVRLVVQEIDLVADEFFNVQSFIRKKNSSGDSIKSLVEIHWQRPNSNGIKLNFDAAVKDDIAVVACIARGGDGEIIMCCAKNVGSCSPTAAEAKAALLAASVANLWGWSSLEFEGDALLIINSINSFPLNQLWEIEVDIESTVHYLNKIANWSVSKVSRSQNEAAHILAKWAKNSKFEGVLVDSFPEVIVSHCRTVATG